MTASQPLPDPSADKATAPSVDATVDTPPMPAQAPAPAGPPARGKKPVAAFAAGLAAGAALIGGVWAISAAQGPAALETFTLTGTMTLTDKVDATDTGCRGSYDSGYDDIQEGADVTVYNASGDVIAKSELGASEEVFTGVCEFQISVPDVPKGETFYKVEVSHRGTVELSAEEAENGELAASLG